MLRLARLLGMISTATLRLAGIGLVAMTAAVAWQVFGRYVLNDSPTWAEPLSLLLMSWFIFLGAAVGVREGYHLGFEILQAIVPAPVAAVFRTVSDLVVVAFGAGMAWFGWWLMAGTWSATIPSLGLPGGFDFMPLVAGGALFVLFGLERLARRAAGLDDLGEAPGEAG